MSGSYCQGCGLPIRLEGDKWIHVWYEYYFVRPCEKAQA